jgi:type IV pilus assembly protein PilW
MSPRSTPHRTQEGFSLVELMIGVVVGLLVVLAVTYAMQGFETQKRSTTAGADAQENGMAALLALEQAVRRGGYGFYADNQLICSAINMWYNGTVISNGGRLMPVEIIDGGAAGSDTVVVTHNDTPFGGAPSRVVKSMPNVSSVVTANVAHGLTNGQLFLVGCPDDPVPCTVMQMTQDPQQIGGGACGGFSTCYDLNHNPGTTGLYNPSNPNLVFTTPVRYGVSDNLGASPPECAPAVVMPMGNFVRQQFAVRCSSLTVNNPFNQPNPACTASPLSFTDATALAGDVVTVQAQYGITANPVSDVVTNWVNATGGTWSAPVANDIRRIKAIRIAVVARSSQPANQAVTNACTNAAGVANTGPCSFEDAEAPVIDLSADANWQRYRYRVFQTTIPLRNVIWGS